MKFGLIKLSFVLVTHQLAFFNALNPKLSFKQKNVLSRAVNSLIEDKTSLGTPIVDFVIGNGEIFKEMLENILLNQSCDYLVEIQGYKQILNKKRRKKFYTIIFADDFASLKKFCTDLSHESFHFNGRFVIILKNDFFGELEKIFEIFWRKFIFNVNVLVNDESLMRISMFTFLPFSGKSCGDTSPLKINEFDGVTWTTEVMFPKKFKNLRKCPILAGSVVNPPGTIIKRLPNGMQINHGFEVDFANGFASALNFTLLLKIYPTGVNNIYANKTAIGLLKHVFEGEVNFIFGIFSIQQLRMELLSETRSFYNDRTILVIPPAVLIGPIEKFFLPFEFFTWIAILLLLAVACVVITVLKFLPSKFYNFIIGKNITNAYLDLWNVLLGGSQIKLPVRNFARFLLMSFVMFCLVMRSCYTGSLFNIMKNDISSREIKSIAELDSLGYTFYIYDTLNARLKDEKFMKR